MARKKPARAGKDKFTSPAVRRELRKRVRGKPTHSSSMETIPQILGAAVLRVLKIALILIIILGFVLLGLGTGMLAGYISTANELTLQDLNNPYETTHIYDINGNELAILTGSQNINREYVPFSQFEHTYIDEAFIAIEDERFRTHPGIDPKRIGSAVISALMNAGTPTHGGSTITQQTVKMISGSDQISAQRKIQEWYSAIQLEKKLSKNQILDLYLNLVPMANSYVGVQSAAKAYFNKEAKDLNLTECAYLAAIPNRPATYNPRTESGRRNSLRRMRTILQLMLQQEKISEKEYEDALNTELIFRQDEQTVTATQINSYYVDYVIEQVIKDLIDKRGYSREMARITVYNYGLKIYTAMDPALQHIAEQVFMDESLFARNPSVLPDIPEHPQGSITVISNQPGQEGRVVAMVGGFGEKTGNFILNRATQTLRQPGSSIKPILVYGPAIDQGVATAASVYQDTPKYLDPQNPRRAWPQNVSLSYSGSVTLRHSLMYSLNTIAADVYKNVLGVDTGLSYLKQLGIDRTKERQIAAALGGFDYGTSSFEMAGAFAAFPNRGLYTKPYVYTKVLNSDGSVLLENTPETRQVFKPETAFIMTNIMQNAVESVSWFRVGQLNSQISAGKTGTTNSLVDSWYCGYTPYYTAAVWYGYDNRNGRKTSIPEIDRYNSQRIWKAAMDALHEGLPKVGFEKPSTVLQRTICTSSGELAGSYCRSRRTEFFVPNTPLTPTRVCTVHKRPEPTKAPTFAALPTPTPRPTARP